MEDPEFYLSAGAAKLMEEYDREKLKLNSIKKMKNFNFETIMNTYYKVLTA